MAKLAFCCLFLVLFCSNLEAKTKGKATKENPDSIHPLIENSAIANKTSTPEEENQIGVSKHRDTSKEDSIKGGTENEKTTSNTALEQPFEEWETETKTSTKASTGKKDKKKKTPKNKKAKTGIDSDEADTFGEAPVNWDRILEAPEDWDTETKSTTTAASEEKSTKTETPKNTEFETKNTTDSAKRDTFGEAPEDWDTILKAPENWDSGTNTTTTGASDKKPTKSKTPKNKESPTTTDSVKSDTFDEAPENWDTTLEVPENWDSGTKGTTTAASEEKSTKTETPKNKESETENTTAKRDKFGEVPEDWDSGTKGTTTATSDKKPTKSKTPKNKESRTTTDSAKSDTFGEAPENWDTVEKTTTEAPEGWDIILQPPEDWDTETEGTTTVAPGKNHKKTKPTKAGKTKTKKPTASGKSPGNETGHKGGVLGNILTVTKTATGIFPKSHKTGVPKNETGHQSGVFSEILTLTGTAMRSLLKNFLMYFDIDLGTSHSIDWFRIVLKLIELHQQNITRIVPSCFERHPISLIELPERLINETMSCIFTPLKNLTETSNGTIYDAMKMYTDFMVFLKDIQEADKFFSLVKLAVSEEKDLMDMNDEVVRLTNSTFEILLLPACIVQKVGGVLGDFQSQYNQTMCCVKAELDKVGCEDQETEDSTPR